MYGHGHKNVVKLAFESFPAWQAQVWKPYEKHVEETCMFPDIYAVDMLEGRTGPWRKYFPPDAKFTHSFLFTSAHESFREHLPPIRFYINKVIAHIKQRKMAEAAQFAGVFSHYIADFSQPAHHYESDIQKLLPTPKRMANCNLHPMIENIESRIKHIAYRARLLGTSEDEFEFYLEQKLAQLYKKAIASIVPMVVFTYQQKNTEVQKVFDKVMAEVVRTFADFCYTSHAVASGDFQKKEISRLNRCDLREIMPYSYDTEYNYGHKPLVDVITTRIHKHARPFRLLIRRGNRKIAEIVRGICTIPHALPMPGKTLSAMIEYRLPAETFNWFEAVLGLCADMEKQAKCSFEVMADGKPLYKSRLLTPKNTAQSVDININGCKRLKLIVRTDGSTDKLAYPIWGELKIIK